jgi:hypothetical protein
MIAPLVSAAAEPPGRLEGLYSSATQGDTTIQFKAVKKVLAEPPYAFSKDAIRDLTKLLILYARTHGKLDLSRSPGNLRVYQDIAVSTEWIASGIGSPHLCFRRSTREEIEKAAAAEVERQLRLSRPAKHRWHLGGINLTPQPIKRSRSMRRLLDKLIQEDTTE